MFCLLPAPVHAAGDRDAPEWVTAGVTAPRVQQQTFVSPAAKTRVSYHLYMPEAYAAEPDRRFPVIYWLHGSGGGLRGIAPLAALFDAAIRDGRLPPLIVVFPNGLSESMWCDSRDGRVPMETIMIHELIPHVDATFRTLARRSGRLLEGFSMGGYGVARLGFKHPGLFCALSLLGAGPLQQVFDPDSAPRADPVHARLLFDTVWGGDQAYFEAQSPWKQAEHYATTKAPALLVRQVVGDRDGTLANNRRFEAHLTGLGIAHDFTVLPGVEHNARSVISALGEANWEFYRTALTPGGSDAPEFAPAWFESVGACLSATVATKVAPTKPDSSGIVGMSGACPGDLYGSPRPDQTVVANLCRRDVTRSLPSTRKMLVMLGPALVPVTAKRATAW